MVNDNWFANASISEYGHGRLYEATAIHPEIHCELKVFACDSIEQARERLAKIADESGIKLQWQK